MTRLEDDTSNTYVARDADSNEIVGSICAAVNDGVVSIGPIAVKPPLKGKGIGTQMV